MKKKLIALLLAAVMTLSLLPVTALAADGEELVPEEVIAEEPVEEELPAEEPAVEEILAEEPVVEEIPVEESAAEEIPAEEPAVEELPAEEPVAEELPTEELTTVENVVAAAVAITAQPVSATATAGGKVKFTVAATGTNLTYQWQYRKTAGGSWTKTTATGYNTPTLTVSATAAKNGYQYRCRVSSGSTTVNSTAATLTVTAALGITAQPANTSVTAGSKAKFTVTATGSNLSYQWQYRKTAGGSWTNTTATGYNTATLTVSATAAKNGYQYRCRVSSGSNTVNSNAATLTVTAALSITAQPKAVTAAAGSKAKFTVTAAGTGLTYQWQYRKSASGSWTKTTATGYNTAALTVSATLSKNGYQYRCKVSSGSTTVNSKAATLSVWGITTQPSDQIAAAGSKAKFTVKATGTDLSYQWQYRKSASASWTNTSATGSTTAALTVSATMAKNLYQYRCKVTCGGKSVYSNAAMLAVYEVNNSLTVTGITLSSTTVAAPGSVSVTVTATGDPDVGEICFRNPETGVTFSTFLMKESDGTLSGSLPISEYAGAGKYQVSYASLYLVSDSGETTDFAIFWGKGNIYYPDCPTEQRLSSTLAAKAFTVTNTHPQDITPPTLQNISLSSTSVALGSTLTITVTATDDLSGFGSNASGNQCMVTIVNLDDPDDAAGWVLNYQENAQNFQAGIMAYPKGRYAVVSVDLMDLAGNTVTLYGKNINVWYGEGYYETLSANEKLPAALTDLTYTVQ